VVAEGALDTPKGDVRCREVVDALSLGTFKPRLDGALSNLIRLKMSLLMAGGWGWMAFQGPQTQTIL